MSVQIVPRSTYIIDSLADLATIQGGIKAGRLYFLMSSPRGLYACYDGTTLEQIGGSNILKVVSGNVQIGSNAAQQTTSGRRYVTVSGDTKAGVVELCTNEADADIVVVGSVQYSDKNSTGIDKRVGAVVTQLSGSQANNRGGKVIIYTKADNGAGISNRVEILNVGGIKMVNSTTAAPDAQLDNSSVHIYLDDTNGAGKLMIKAKTANGTVATGSVNLT